MGIFGRSAADETLIHEQNVELAMLRSKVQNRDADLKAARVEIERQRNIIAEGHFRDPQNGRLGKKGKVPAALDRNIRRLLGLA